MCVPLWLRFRHDSADKEPFMAPVRPPEETPGPPPPPPQPDNNDIWCHHSSATLLGRMTRGSGSEDQTRTHTSTHTPTAFGKFFVVVMDMLLFLAGRLQVFSRHVVVVTEHFQSYPRSEVRHLAQSDKA